MSLARTDYRPGSKSGAVVSVLKSLGPQQRVGQVKQQAQGDDAGERIIEDHGCSPQRAFSSEVDTGSLEENASGIN
jgi:hypothetical protein